MTERIRLDVIFVTKSLYLLIFNHSAMNNAAFVLVTVR